MRPLTSGTVSWCLLTVFGVVAVTGVAAGQATPEPPPEPSKAEKALRDSLLRVPEVGLTATSDSAREAVNADARAATLKGSLIVLDAQKEQWRRLGLKPIAESDCQRREQEARAVQDTASLLRDLEVVSQVGRRGEVQPPEITTVRQLGELGVEYYIPGRGPTALLSIPAFTQMLPAEGEGSRLLLVAVLAQGDKSTSKVPVGGSEHTAALARLALYDPSPAVRREAVKALAKWPREDYRQLLLDGLRHPWPPVAEHASEALAELRDREAAPELQRLLDAPDPAAPVMPTGKKRTAMVRELVRLNHLRNCLLCHAPASQGDQLLRARVPPPGQPLSPDYYARRSSNSIDIFVRADITYLRQDFSVTLPVADAKPWPEMQRFDFLVRTRDAAAEEMEAHKHAKGSYPQRDAVLWALTELRR